MVPPSTEAMALNIYKNCYKKWLAWKEFRKDNPEADLPRYSPGEQHDATKKYRHLFSDGTSGRGGLRSWNDAGLTHFNGLKGAIKKNREDNTERIAQVEEAFINRQFHRYKDAERAKIEKAGKNFDEVWAKREKRKGNAVASAAVPSVSVDNDEE